MKIFKKLNQLLSEINHKIRLYQSHAQQIKDENIEYEKQRLNILYRRKESGPQSIVYQDVSAD